MISCLMLMWSAISLSVQLWILLSYISVDYQGLTKSFCHGKIYCSSITAKLVNLKIGIPWDKIQVLPINQKINIAGVDVICFDANHCPGSLIILFEPPNGKVWYKLVCPMLFLSSSLIVLVRISCLFHAIGCPAHGGFPILWRNDKEFNLADLWCPHCHPRYNILWPSGILDW